MLAFTGRQKPSLVLMLVNSQDLIEVNSKSPNRILVAASF